LVGNVQLVLVIGAKLQYVVSTLALEVADAPGAYVGHLLRPRDELFWFRRPDLVLSILHLVLFQVRISHPNINTVAASLVEKNNV